jgi:magnesium-transporting ATPase (P-type)
MAFPTSLNARALTPLQDLLEPAVILLILAANATVGLWQRGNADAALQALKECQCPKARVLRRAEGAESSQFVTVPAVELVPGDVVTVSVACGPVVFHYQHGHHSLSLENSHR